MESFLTNFLTHWGYLALVVFGFVQACSIPISSEVTFGFAGVLAYQGKLNLVAIIVIGTLAELAGSSVSYAVGRIGGRPTVERLGRYVLVTRSDLDRVENFLAGRGAWTVAVGRVLPVVRAFVGIVAGFAEIPVGPFALFNLIGTVIWATAVTLAGYAAGSAWHRVAKYLSLGGYVIAAVIIIGLAALIWHRVHAVRKERAADAAARASIRPAGYPAEGGGYPAQDGGYPAQDAGYPAQDGYHVQEGAPAGYQDPAGDAGYRPRPASHRRTPDGR